MCVDAHRRFGCKPFPGNCNKGDPLIVLYGAQRTLRGLERSKAAVFPGPHPMSISHTVTHSFNLAGSCTMLHTQTHTHHTCTHTHHTCTHTRIPTRTHAQPSSTNMIYWKYRMICHWICLCRHKWVFIAMATKPVLCTQCEREMASCGAASGHQKSGVVVVSRSRGRWPHTPPTHTTTSTPLPYPTYTTTTLLLQYVYHTRNNKYTMHVYTSYITHLT